MNPELLKIQTSFRQLYLDQIVVLRARTRRELEDLLHESEELRNHELLSIRAAAEINRAAATLILEERGK